MSKLEMRNRDNPTKSVRHNVVGRLRQRHEEPLREVPHETRDRASTSLQSVREDPFIH